MNMNGQNTVYANPTKCTWCNPVGHGFTVIKSYQGLLGIAIGTILWRGFSVISTKIALFRQIMFCTIEYLTVQPKFNMSRTLSTDIKLSKIADAIRHTWTRCGDSIFRLVKSYQHTLSMHVVTILKRIFGDIVVKMDRINPKRVFCTLYYQNCGSTVQITEVGDNVTNKENKNEV